MVSIVRSRSIAYLVLLAALGCRSAPRGGEADAGAHDAPSIGEDGAVDRDAGASRAPDGIDTYLDDLDAHPGCTTEGLDYAAAEIPGYRCAARLFAPAVEDRALPIVLLVHGNSDRPSAWEAFRGGECTTRGATEGAPMLGERLAGVGHRVYAVDMRHDRALPSGDAVVLNAARNIDHGWGVPIVQHFVRSVIEAHPDRRFAIVGHSLGATVVRDALRRLWARDRFEVWSYLDDVVLLAGASHGLSTFALCRTDPSMRGRVACELGDRTAYAPTPFLEALNGPEGAFETPCASGDLAFGVAGACGAHRIAYTTLVMEDLPDGSQLDEFVSEASSSLVGAENLTIGVADLDTSNYFFCGLFANHYGPARSEEALRIVLERLAD